jgi:hypothetical protein
VINPGTDFCFFESSRENPVVLRLLKAFLFEFGSHETKIGFPPRATVRDAIEKVEADHLCAVAQIIGYTRTRTRAEAAGGASTT